MNLHPSAELRFTTLRPPVHATEAPPLLNAEGLTIRVGIRKVIVKLNLVVFEGEVVLVEGQNGSGKSSLLNALAGVPPASVEAGRIAFRGVDITTTPPHERIALGLGYVPQRNNVFSSLTVAEHVRLVLGKEGLPTYNAARAAGQGLPDPAVRAGLLSGGERQRLVWFLGLARRSALLLADEPDAGRSGPVVLPKAGTFLIATHSAHLWQVEDV